MVPRQESNQRRRPMALSDVERDVLEFERLRWKYVGAKESAVLEQFGWSMTRHTEVLNRLLEDPATRLLPTHESLSPPDVSEADQKYPSVTGLLAMGNGHRTSLGSPTLRRLKEGEF